jgi:hypothetical protein
MAEEPAEWLGTLRRSVERYVAASRAVLWNCRCFVPLKIIWVLVVKHYLKPGISGIKLFTVVETTTPASSLHFHRREIRAHINFQIQNNVTANESAAWQM